MLQNLRARRDYAGGSLPFVKALTGTANALLGSRGCLFTFHRVAATSIWETLPNRNFYLDLSFLDQLLSYLVRNGWAIVTIDEMLQRLHRGDRSGRYVNFSVDDCYRDTFEQVVPLFRRHGVPVTLFVTTGIPDETMPLWCSGLEDVILHRDFVRLRNDTMVVDTPTEKRRAYDRIATEWDGPEAGCHYCEFCALNDIDERALHWKHAISWQMLESFRSDALVEIGAHTVTHARISTSVPQTALAELKGSRERLEERLGISVRHFAFPYGRSGDCGERDFALAREAGFVSAATTRKGVIRRGRDLFSLPRNTLNGSHRNLAMVELHLAGITGVAARMIGRV